MNADKISNKKTILKNSDAIDLKILLRRNMPRFVA